MSHYRFGFGIIPLECHVLFNGRVLGRTRAHKLIGHEETPDVGLDGQWSLFGWYVSALPISRLTSKTSHGGQGLFWA